MKKTKRTWAQLFPLYRGTNVGLARYMGVSRVTLHNLIVIKHASAPHELLGTLAEAFKDAGMADGSEPPDQAELFLLWTAAAKKEHR